MKLWNHASRFVLLSRTMVCAIALQSGTVNAQQTPGSNVTVVDILLDPDATMLQHAADNNAHLLKVFPKGFTLDAMHRPHVTIVQRFVRTSDLNQVYTAVGKVLASENVTGIKLEAYKYYYIPDKAIGLAGIVAHPNPELLKLQQDVIAAVTPFTVETGTSAVYQLGQFGTAAKKLNEWKLQP